MAVSHLFAAAAGAGAGVAGVRLREAALARTARLAGSTVAAPSAAAWVTDFLNAAYYAKDVSERELDELRLAFMIVTTYWDRRGIRRLRASDVLRFHEAFGMARLRGSGGKIGTLASEALLEGGAKLLGGWFPEAAQDWDRTGWGIAFPTVEAKRAHDPERRLARAELGPLAPPMRPEPEQTWHTYPPVEVPDAAATAEAILAVEHWPDYASELGRFTPLRRGGLDGQTFEIEVVGFPTARTPVFTRAYVTVRELVTRARPLALHEWVSEVQRGFVARPSEASPIPEDAEVHAGFDLVGHEGHFMGNAKNRLILYSLDGRSYLRAAGTWDPMTRSLAELYDRVGRWSQHAFWGMDSPERSMLHQIAHHAAQRLPSAARPMA